jgi:Transposase DDE domain
LPQGDEPIAWYLVTNEPIATLEQVAAVVDAYRARWVVEEFFKALKTGCQIEKRQMESYGALASRWRCFFSSPFACWPCETLHAASPTLLAQRCLPGNCSCCVLAEPNP